VGCAQDAEAVFNVGNRLIRKADFNGIGHAPAEGQTKRMRVMALGKTLLYFFGFAGIAFGFLVTVLAPPNFNGGFSGLSLWLAVGPLTWIPGCILVATAKLVKRIWRRALVVVGSIGLAFVWLLVLGYLVFACYGCGFTASAEVSVVSISCTGTTNVTCSARLANPGAAGTQVVSGSIMTGGQSASGTCQRLTLPSGGSITSVKCTFPIAPGEPGQAFSGSIETSNGAAVPFAGVFVQQDNGQQATDSTITSTEITSSEVTITLTSWTGQPPSP
jgi:hypothetical protein